METDFRSEKVGKEQPRLLSDRNEKLVGKSRSRGRAVVGKTREKLKGQARLRTGPTRHVRTRMHAAAERLHAAAG
eukprot:5092183-Pleurochrysis_carterae.AAC.2